MSIQRTKLELIKMIMNIQSEELLERLKLFLQQTGGPTDKEAPVLTEAESRLLLKINEDLPEEVQIRYHELTTKSVEETLTEEEHQELLGLIPQVEAKSAERLKYLIELAALWKVSVDEVMDRLGITPPPVIHF